MAQKLIQPINNARLTASYKWRDAYKRQFKATHYGQDMTGGPIVYAQGNGTVAFAGWDNVCGWVVGIVYKDCYSWYYKTVSDITGRYYHMADVRVKPGQRVTKDTRIGTVGNTGKYTTGAHLHVELDTDTKYPNYTPTLAGNSNILKKGTRGAKDTTVDPMRWTHTKASAPDNQTIVAGYGSDWVDPRDAKLPKI
ncbi:M23 family metallopeptidase [Acetanaerobacterium sp. MSJ-12]|uniref:M23 family metallopeptidase n=1 Tax=Acetanaerobacterium sp. MSJ-12 TaxID=2841535 RepID=UPI001C0EC619|nr:M23 family metallopeptidase [Acetanaerobacterium sp. MSJ-12]MBU5419594.1 M23 family metallopeptidase [Acetanaerobacterium sp. MSJ-12]